MNVIDKNGLKINSTLYEFINNEAIPGTGIDPENFWLKFEKIVHELAPINLDLLNKREEIQNKIDEWHKSRFDKDLSITEYKKFLKSINYIVEEKEDFIIGTSNTDIEITNIAGPQLVVPVVMLDTH